MKDKHLTPFYIRHRQMERVELEETARGFIGLAAMIAVLLIVLYYIGGA